MAFLLRADPHAVRIARFGMTVLLAGGAGTIGSLVLINSVSDSPLAPSVRARTNFTTVLPEGWAFFTRNPREARQVLFQRHAGAWELVPQRHADRANYFGFGRFARAQMIELLAMLDQVPQTTWTAFPTSRDPLVVPVAPVPVHNPALHPLLCGDLLVVERGPVPWAWSTAPRPIQMAGRLLRLTAACASSTGPPREATKPSAGGTTTTGAVE